MAEFGAGPKNKAAAEQATPRAYAGDEVFFHRGSSPVSGKVLATGKHGCTVEHDGARHKVLWENIAGHKKRSVQRYKVLEQGEDGLIVETANKERRFVGIPPEARQERLKLNK